MHSAPSHGDRTPLGCAPRRILLIDDDADARTLIATILERAGFRVTAIAGLEQAQAYLERERFHLVLTDLYLGEQHLGFEIAELARSRRPALPVILITGHPSYAGAVEAMRSRICEIFVKPVDPLRLVNACHRAIEESETRRRNEELETQNQFLRSVLPRALDVKDPLTKGHSERVVRYADALARHCKVDDDDRESLRTAALLHDVGKIATPERILTKEGPLTVEEREIVQRHPRAGYDILAPISNRDVRDWVFQHHERWDGTGYPNQLNKEEVALPGRILILAEVFDALAEVRSYKDAWPLPKISAFFRHEAGKHFDPDLAHTVADGLDTHGERYFASGPGLLF